ncbi:hypothetical protein VTK73DRAFT_1074 [Phialemonium thermophilum]|uniref:Carboxylic ester hydrolase n=1 Tax=Phialemonium thermophilum TaxID=223376 RepID=A0ABR3XB05_9PEZI
MSSNRAPSYTRCMSLASLSNGQAVTSITDWGANPTGLELHGYIPSSLPAKPGVILALHPCGGSGLQYSRQTKYTAFADKGGFITLFPSTKNDYNCWDVATNKSLTRDGGGDSTGLSNIIKWAKSKYNADPAKIFVTGSSSGCMMTNIMCATYPDVFAASSCYSGMPAGCLAGASGSSPITVGDRRCEQGKMVKTGAEWAKEVQAIYPGYNGTYPKMLIWHGDADRVISYTNLAETLKQWSAVKGLSFTKNITNTPQAGYTQMIYGDGTELVGYSAAGVGHTVPVHDDIDLKWFNL